MMRAVEAHSCRRHSPAGQCGAPFFCALDALAVDDRSARAGVPPRQLPACHIERVVNAPERAVVVPSVEVVVQGAARRQVLGDRGPLAARAQDVHEAVGHLAQVDRPLVPAALGGRDQRGDQRPFRVGQVTWVAQLAAIVATTVLTRPHQRLPPDQAAANGSTTESKHSRCSRMDTKRADYVLALKGNQGALPADVELFVAEQKSNGFKHATSSRDETVDGDHGRIETRTTTVIHDVSWLQERHDWPGLNGIVIVDSIREIGRTIERETRLFITSLSLPAKSLAVIVRSHWAVENR